MRTAIVSVSDILTDLTPEFHTRRRPGETYAHCVTRVTVSNKVASLARQLSRCERLVTEIHALMTELGEGSGMETN